MNTHLLLLPQALLGGFSLINLFTTYLLSLSMPKYQYLQYYSPVSQDFSRIYYSLITLSVIAATARYCHDKIRRFQPLRLRLRWVDGFQIAFYVVAYVCTVLCVPLDDQLTYEYNRNPMFFQLTFNSSFKSRLSTWNALNLVRIIFCGLGLLLLCYQYSPYVFMHTVNYETREKLKELLAPTARFDPAMSMVPPTPPVVRRKQGSG